MTKLPSPPDQNQRDIITGDLDNTILVEAAAGTGKTTCLVDRMVNLLRHDKCDISTLAAVTFTRKAAAELRTRFQLKLGEVARKAPSGSAEQRRLQHGVEHVEQCFIGTIHSFCSRLLRERPFEAKVDPDFSELDQASDAALRKQVWREHVATLISTDDPVLRELEEVGLQISSDLRRPRGLVDELQELGLDAAELGPAFLDLVDYPDVTDWPAESLPMPEVAGFRTLLQNYINEMDGFDFPDNRGTDKLMSRYEEIVRKSRNVDLDRLWEMMELLDLFDSTTPTQKFWPTKEMGKAAKKRWEEFRDNHVKPLRLLWQQHRYQPCLRAILPARALYDQKRAAANCLNFQDLLLRSAELLQQHPEVRRYFRRRFTHLLVDEFQDTDPIQAQVMLLLTADDDQETDWQKCRPVPGSLFVVGDPKQSIYRFRRADIQIYSKVKSIIEGSHGKVATLSANFRSVKPIIDFVNSTFNDFFPAVATDESPANGPLEGGRADSSADCIQKIAIPERLQYPAEITQYESDFIARTIRKALNEQWPVVRRNDEQEAGLPDHVLPSDFLIIARYSTRFSIYANAMQRQGIPFVVSGGSTLQGVPELRMLQQLVKAMTRPDDPIALLAVLRGEIFGISDVQLYEFRNADGVFNYQVDVPETLADQFAQPIRTAFTLLRQLSGHLKRLPTGTALERIATDSGLLARAAAAGDGGIRAGSLMKAIELCRSSTSTLTSADLAAQLQSLIDESEKHNAMTARSPLQEPVRMMTLHQCKGLEAAIVFLADPSGESDRQVSNYIDRSQQTKGYLPIYGQPTNQWKRTARRLLAAPENWHDLADREQRFLTAEQHRLLYVAATRAGSRLIISERQKRTSESPWQLFEAALANVPAIPDPGDVSVPPVAAGDLRDEARSEHIDQQWQSIATPTYNVMALKDTAITSKTNQPRSSEKHGKEWGNVLHQLLEATMKHPAAALKPLAVASLRMEALSLDLLDDVLETVQRIVASDFWKRVQQSEHRLAEVPLTTLADTEFPTILRGVIDLVFRETSGWVIVDYKSERVDSSALPQLTDYYRPQLQVYAEYWSALTGEDVSETGIYYTHTGTYVTV